MKYLYLILVITAFFSCQDKKKDEISLLVSEWQGKEIIFPSNLVFTKFVYDTVNYKIKNTKYKILVYVDSLGCTECKLQLPKWKKLINHIDSLEGKSIPFLFFFHTKDCEETRYMLKKEHFDYPVCIDKQDALNKINQFPSSIMFQTFLLDQDNKVVVIGNPIHNLAVKDLYLNQITKKKELKPIETTAEVKYTEINMGTIQLNHPKENIFEIKNTGELPLVILDIATSCNCVLTTFEKHSAKPGETLQLIIKINPYKAGAFNEYITIKCNTKKLIKLNITGNII